METDPLSARLILADAQLEELGRRHARDTLDPSGLQARLAGADWIDDTEFAAYGLDDRAITELRHRAQEWATDVAERLLEGRPRRRTDAFGMTISVVIGRRSCRR